MNHERDFHLMNNNAVFPSEDNNSERFKTVNKAMFDDATIKAGIELQTKVEVENGENNAFVAKRKAGKKLYRNNVFVDSGSKELIWGSPTPDNNVDRFV